MRFLEVILNLGESSLNKDKRIDELLDAGERLQVEFVSRESEMEELRADMCDEIEKIKKERDEFQRQESEPVCGWVGCFGERQGGWRFCEHHLTRARKELTESGYLQSVPWRGGGVRTPSMMENTRETKHGRD
jgi:hypothetical protein